MLHSFETAAHEWETTAHSKAGGTLDSLIADQHSLSSRWASVAAPLIAAIDADPNHPALKLIHKTEPKGGSVMELTLMRPSELLIDMFDAEDYLRNDIRQHGENPRENLIVERDLRRAFGDAAYDVSRRFIALWQDRAATLLEPVMPKAEIAGLREKWGQDPFCHAIYIHELKEFDPTPTRGFGAALQ